MKSRRSRSSRSAAVRSLGAERAAKLNGSPKRNRKTNEQAHLLDRRYSSLNTYTDSESDYFDDGTQDERVFDNSRRGMNNTRSRNNGRYSTFSASPIRRDSPFLEEHEEDMSYELVESLDPTHAGFDHQRGSSGSTNKDDDRMSVSSIGSTNGVGNPDQHDNGISYFDLTREQLRFVFQTILREKKLEESLRLQKQQQLQQLHQQQKQDTKSSPHVQLSDLTEPESSSMSKQHSGAGQHGDANGYDDLHDHVDDVAAVASECSGSHVDAPVHAPPPSLDYAGFREALARSRIVFKDDKVFDNLARRVDGNGDGKITFRSFEKAVQSLKLAHLFKTYTNIVSPFGVDVGRTQISTDTSAFHSVAGSADTKPIPIPKRTGTEKQQDITGSAKAAHSSLNVAPNYSPQGVGVLSPVSNSRHALSMLGCIDYNTTRYEQVIALRDLRKFMYSGRAPWALNRWIDMPIVDSFLVKALTIKYRLHPLAVEDLLDTTQSGLMRARTDRFDGHLFLIFPVLSVAMVRGMGDTNHSSPSPSKQDPRRRSSPRGRSSRVWEKLGRAAQRGDYHSIPTASSTSMPLDATSHAGLNENWTSTPIGQGTRRWSISSQDLADAQGNLGADGLPDSWPVVKRQMLSMFVTMPDSSTLITIGATQAVSAAARRALIVPHSRCRGHNSLFFMYSILSDVVDNYTPVVDCLAGFLMELRTRFRHKEPSNAIYAQTADDIRFYAVYHHIVSEITTLRRWLLPAARVVRHLLEVCDPWEMDPGLLVYLRDVGDHIEQVNDDIATLLDECRAFKDEYEHSIEVRQNGAMTAVTVLAATFLPAQFLTGVFGMNFEGMPELHWRWGYPLFWGLVVLSWLLVFLLFRNSRFL